MQYNGIILPLPQWFVQGHNATLKKKLFRKLPRSPTTKMNSWMNLIKETFTNRRGDHHIHSLEAYRLLLETFPMLSLSRRCWCSKSIKSTSWKRLLFTWLYFDDRWNVFVKMCTVSIRRVRRSRGGRKSVQRNCCVYGSWIKIVYTFCCSSHSRSHI